jgi:hypothetical protein
MAQFLHTSTIVFRRHKLHPALLLPNLSDNHSNRKSPC